MKLIIGAYYECTTLDGSLCILKILSGNVNNKLQVCIYNFSRNGCRVGDFWTSHLRGKGMLLNSDRQFEKYKYMIAMIGIHVDNNRRR